MWFDTHCHLDAAEFDHDRDAVIAQACGAGVSRIVVPAVGAENFAAVETLCARHSARMAGDRPGGLLPAARLPDNLQENAHAAAPAVRLLPAYGIHPMYTPQAAESDLPMLHDWLKDRLLAGTPDHLRPVAIGEIGLDGFVPGLDLARQEYFFAEQLKLAVEFDLPVILHIRRAQDTVLKHLRRHRSHFASRGAGRAGIAHAFNGSVQQAEEFIGLGFLLGFGGAMTFDGSSRIRTLARELPLEVIALETDAPDIAPAWLVGGRNSPAELPRMAGVLAGLRSVAPGSIAAATYRNAARLFEKR